MSGNESDTYSKGMGRRPEGTSLRMPRTRVGAFAQTRELRAGFRAHCILAAVTLFKHIAGELTTLGSTHTNFSLLFSFHFPTS